MQITRLTKDEFLTRTHKDYAVLSDGTENHPRDYFLIQTAPDAGVYLYQVNIGLTEIPTLEIPDLSLCMIASTFRLFVVETQTAQVIDTLDLTTPCMELIYRQNRVAIICETEVIFYDTSTRTYLPSLSLSDAIQDILHTPDAITLLLYDGTRVSLSREDI